MPAPNSLPARFRSIAAAAESLGVSAEILERAKAQKCPAFKGRFVDCRELLRWAVQERVGKSVVAMSDDEALPTTLDELKVVEMKEKVMRQRALRLQAQGKTWSTDEVVRNITIQHAGIVAALRDEIERLPGILDGMAAKSAKKVLLESFGRICDKVSKSTELWKSGTVRSGTPEMDSEEDGD